MFSQPWLWSIIHLYGVWSLVLNPPLRLGSSSSNQTAANYESLYCDAAVFGQPTLSDCREAMQAIPYSTATITFRNRRVKPFTSIVLPHRFMSSDGVCVIELGFISPMTAVEHATSSELRNAAEDLMSACVGNGGMGGIVSGLGEAHQLRIQVLEYEPRVVCSIMAIENSGPSGCSTLLQDIPALDMVQTFGNAGSGADVKLPITYSDRALGCAIEFRLDGEPVRYRWHDLWSAAVAVTSMCSSRGMTGQATIGVGSSVFRVIVANSNAPRTTAII